MLWELSESDLKGIEETASCAISIHSSFLTIRDRLGILPFTRCDLSIDRNGVTTRNGDENTFLLPLVFRNDTPNRSAVRRPFGNQAK